MTEWIRRKDQEVPDDHILYCIANKIEVSIMFGDDYNKQIKSTSSSDDLHLPKYTHWKEWLKLPEDNE